MRTILPCLLLLGLRSGVSAAPLESWQEVTAGDYTLAGANRIPVLRALLVLDGQRRAGIVQ